MFKRIILQIAICTVIYFIFYMIQNTNYIFSKNVIKKANEILSYDISLQNLYEQGKKYIDKYINNVGSNVADEIQDEKSNETEDAGVGDLSLRRPTR